MNVAIMQHSCKYVNRELCSNPVKQNFEMDNSSGKRIMNATKTISLSYFCFIKSRPTFRKRYRLVKCQLDAQTSGLECCRNQEHSASPTYLPTQRNIETQCRCQAVNLTIGVHEHYSTSIIFNFLKCMLHVSLRTTDWLGFL